MGQTKQQYLKSKRLQARQQARIKKLVNSPSYKMGKEEETKEFHLKGGASYKGPGKRGMIDRRKRGYRYATPTDQVRLVCDDCTTEVQNAKVKLDDKVYQKQSDGWHVKLKSGGWHKNPIKNSIIIMGLERLLPEILKPYRKTRNYSSV